MSMNLRDRERFDDYVSMFQSMCLDVAMGGITAETFLMNMEMAVVLMRDQCFEDKEVGE